MSCQGPPVCGLVCVARPCGQLVRQMLLVSKGCLGVRVDSSPGLPAGGSEGVVLSQETHRLLR